MAMMLYCIRRCHRKLQNQTKPIHYLWQSSPATLEAAAWICEWTCFELWVLVKYSLLVEQPTTTVCVLGTLLTIDALVVPILPSLCMVCHLQDSLTSFLPEALMLFFQNRFWPECTDLMTALFINLLNLIRNQRKWASVYLIYFHLESCWVELCCSMFVFSEPLGELH